MEGQLDKVDLFDSRQFMIAVKRLADSINYGTDASPFLGAGIEFVQSRQYQPGEPVRSVDWRVTARTGKHYVKEYETPRSLPCYLLLDRSASMTVQSGRKSKYAVALHIAGGLALACLERVSPVGVVGAGSEGFRVRPSLSKHQIFQWLHRLRKFRYDETTILADRIVELNANAPHRALVVVLSDLHEPAAIPALKQLAQMHDCVVLQLRDPAEVSLRGAGLLRAREAETGRAFVTHGRARWLAQDEIERELKLGGIDHLVIRTDEPFVHRLRYFLRSRGLLGKGAR